MGDDQFAARLGQVGVDTRVGFHDVGQTQLEVGGDLLQRTVVRGYHVLLVLTDQTAVGCRQLVFNGGGLLADQRQST